MVAGTMSRPHVLTLGEPIVAILPESPVPLSEDVSCRWLVGGAELNVAVGLHRLGVDARFVGRIGDDPLGEMVAQHLRDEGLDAGGLVRDEHRPTACYIREWLPDGVRRLVYHRTGCAGSALEPADLTWPDPPPTLVHLTGITPALSTSAADAIETVLERAANDGIPVSFDPNHRPRLWGMERARSVLRSIAERCQVLLMSEEDRALLFPDCTDREAATRAVELGPNITVVKRGAAGAIAFDGDRVVEVEADEVTQAVDPVGAGDGFDAGFLAGHLRGLTLEDCLRLGAHVGARAVEQPGEHPSYPHLHELPAKLSSLFGGTAEA